jgi:retinoid hydroxylase
VTGWELFTHYLLLITCLMILKQRLQLKSAEEMPGSFGNSAKGETEALFAGEEMFYRDRFRRYGSVFKSRIFGKKFAFLIGAEANKLVLMDKVDHLSAEQGWIFLKPIFGTGLLLQDGKRHKATRRLVHPALHGEALSNYFATIEAIATEFLQEKTTQGTVSAIEAFTEFSLTVALRLILGTETTSEFYEALQYFLTMLVGRRARLHLDLPFTLYGRSQSARRKLKTFLQKKIAARQIKGDLKESQDFLGLFLASVTENGDYLSDTEIIDQLLMVLFAGHENPAVLISWLLLELNANPEWQERLSNEQQEVIGNESLNLSHLKQFTNLGYALKEVERLYPPVQNISRGVVKDIEYDGYRIPAGWMVDVSPMLTHRLPEIYPNPDCFDPDRFAPPREEDKKHPFSLVGFGAGSHVCLGYQFAQMEMKIFMSLLLRNYDWQITPAKSALAPIYEPSKIQDDLKVKINLK